MMQKIIILDFGSQYTQLIARRIREMHTYCEILPYNKFPEGDADVRGVVLSGSPFSVNQAEAFKPDLSGIRGKYPLLGICYGAQYLAQSSGGTVGSSDSREYGRARLASFDAADPLMQGVREHSQVWMSHGDTILQLPANFRIVASTADVPVAAYRIEGEPTWAVQFHPEVYHSEDGSAILRNFVHGICGCSADWTPASFIDSTIAELQHQLGTDQVVLGLSGGVDSTVAAMLLNRAIGDRLHCIFVDNGLLRLNEFSSVLKHYKLLGLNVTGVDASQRFYAALAGESDPEKKRKIIGKGFIEVFEEEAKKLSDVKWLAQGTIYPDRIESLSITGMVIKSHHNVGGLPERMKMQVVEPLKLLFKDEVREVGRALGIPESFIARHPFPGPGLGVRILGDITPEKVRILQEADDIFINGLKTNKLYDKVWQAGVILLPIRSVGVMGDERTYENAVALRAVCSTDGMTADWADLPNDFLRAVSNEIINKVRGINRVVYDVSSKPPATIEWE
ncbi:MAG: glutamine-hydrolyzing GMP synthase [Bacteroidales bacterium]|nr:glutamine-hydrolyzing GMP synthase [Bacteroidales bacterium]